MKKTIGISLFFLLAACASPPRNLPEVDQAQWRADAEECKQKGMDEQRKNSTALDYVLNALVPLLRSAGDNGSPQHAVDVANSCMEAKGWPKPF